MQRTIKCTRAMASTQPTFPVGQPFVFEWRQRASKSKGKQRETERDHQQQKATAKNSSSIKPNIMIFRSLFSFDRAHHGSISSGLITPLDEQADDRRQIQLELPVLAL
jgi:hypothetical protein